MKSKSQSDTKNSVHRVTPPVSKHRGDIDGRKEWRPIGKTTRIRKNDCQSTSTPVIVDTEPLFTKLDLTDEVQSNRMQQRRKQIAMGKNTAGYECYNQHVPKSCRKPRSMDTPSTPDHTLDIPAKRWAGIVRAW
jgi:Histone RNA hairpin-binding protein RNA-binding domain